MFPRRSAAVAFVLASTVAACAGLTGCAADTSDQGDDPAIEGNGDGTSEDAIISEHSLVGNELPDHTLALTFDDGPGPRTKELADYLATEDIQATFFINGKNVPGRQASLAAELAGGHIIGNHTQNHVQLTKLSSAKLISEVTLTDNFIAEVQPNGPWLLRPPFGAWNGTSARTLNATPMKKYVGSVFWDVGGVLTATAAADWDCWGKHVSIAKCGDLYMNEMNTKKKGIVLMHDIHSNTVDMVKLIVPKLKAAGWKFTSVPEVPSIKRAIANVSVVTAGTDACSSSTLGHAVPENACVQSRSDQKWHRCENKEWVESTGAADPKCTGGKFALP